MDSQTKKVITVGSRKSELALIQTNYVIDCLKKVHPDVEFKIVTMTTLGDRILNVSLPKIGEKALFTKDLEDALRNNTVDFVVHSLKDLPTTLPDGLAIGAVFEREDPRDALVLKENFKDHSLSTLPEGSVIDGGHGQRRQQQPRQQRWRLHASSVLDGEQVQRHPQQQRQSDRSSPGSDVMHLLTVVGTSSLRRTAQLHASYPQLKVVDVRGNLNTRLRKLDADDGQYAALLLASAGLQRMGWGDRVSKVLPCSEMMYAVGQGALAVECRENNSDILAMLAPFNHAETYCRILAERSFLRTLGGGCSAPVGVSTKLKPFDTQFKLTITGAVWSLDGTTKITHTLEQTFDQIKKPSKHKLSPTEDNDTKKFKTEHNNGNTVNRVEELNRRITNQDSNLNCEDTTENIQVVNPLYCGLTENLSMPLDVIIKCDNIGKDLAKILISQGATEVMKVSQDIIRNSVSDS